MGCWGLLGVAGMINLLVMKWIEMDHSRKIPCVKRSSKFSVLKPPMNSMEG